MKKTLTLLLLSVVLVLPLALHAQTIIPQPDSISRSSGFFVLSKDTRIYTDLTGKEAQQLRNYVTETMQLHRFGPLKAGKSTVKNSIHLLVIRIKDLSVTQEQSYTLNITPNKITVIARTPQGLFYALQTIRQLTAEGRVACVSVKDEPRFRYRGMMLDCSRHFFPVSFIKKQLDAMAYFKLNRFHWHLTDGGGWRLEIKKYPKLIEETAFRTQSDWTKWWRNRDRRYCHATDSGAYGGYYTQQEVRDIVQYAAERHITVIPEIEMPGHSNEVFVAYPELCCTGKPYSGPDFCAGNDSVFAFLEGVLTEVMQLFPSEYIHIGGDEAWQEAWKTCPKCQERMQKMGLKNTNELQADFVMRIERFLNAHGKKLLGWDEIMEGRLAPNAAVMSWRGEEAGLSAARDGHHVVMTPTAYCYLDYYQDVPFSQPKAFGGYLPLEKVYAYEPLPADARGTNVERLMDGVQGNLWTEEIPTPEHAEYMLYPRLLAIAEVGWSRHRTSYANFRERTLTALDRLKAAGYHHFDLRKEIGSRKEALHPCAHAGVGKAVTYTRAYAKKYAGAGDSTLTDGQRADWNFKDRRWQGFVGETGMDVTVDMGRTVDLHELSVDFMQSLGVDIVFPADVELSVSLDGQNFTLIDRLSTPRNAHREFFIEPYTWKGSAQARYVRLKAWQPKDGGWIFTDEIRVN